MDPEALVDLITRGGVIGVLTLGIFFVLVGLRRKWFVQGWVFEDVKEERDHYRRLAERGTGLAEEATGLSERELTLYIKRIERRLEDVEAGRDGR